MPCEHGKQKSRCKLCGGSSICEHGKRRIECKACGGSSICVHGRQKHRCKPCGGHGICEHGKQKSFCPVCGGSGICEHGKRRSYCKDCGGSSICEHGRVKSTCKDCGGSSVCKHNRLRSVCKLCGGGSICEHGRVRSYCKDCGGGGVCLHNRVRSNCRLCGSAGQCEHGIRRIDCAVCGGPCDCGSGKPKSKCVPCREQKKATLAAEAARLAAQLGVTVPELTIPPTEIPLLASKLPDVMGVSASAPLLKSNIGLSGDLCSSFDFHSLVSRLKSPLNSHLFEMGSTPQTTSYVPGLEVGADLGLLSFLKQPGLLADPMGMASQMKPVYDLSNALLVAARAEVEQMMAQILAQNASNAVLYAQAESYPQAQSATLPGPFSLSTSAFPAISPAASLASHSNHQNYQPVLSSATLADILALHAMAPALGPAHPNVGST